jgi:type IV pilus assembly protein PilB
MGIEPFLVSSVMLLSIAQRLVRRICPYCKKQYKPPEEVVKYWKMDKVKDANFVRGTGCFNCMDKGYKGRTGIYETLIIDEMIQDMILKKKSAKEISFAAHKSGLLRTLKEDATEKVLAGVTTLEEAALAVMV